MTVRELNGGLLWITIEGPRDKVEVQAWLSAFSVPPVHLEAFWKKRQQRFQEIILD